MKSILEIIGDNHIGSAEDMGGNDKIESGDGDDTNYGDNLDGTGIGGNDQINSGAVNDENNGGGGNDRIKSGKGDDTNNGDDGNDKIEWEGQRLKQWWYWR